MRPTLRESSLLAGFFSPLPFVMSRSQAETVVSDSSTSSAPAAATAPTPQMGEELSGQLTPMENGLLGIKLESGEVVEIDMREQWKFLEVIGWSFAEEWKAICMPATPDGKTVEPQVGVTVLILPVDEDKSAELELSAKTEHDKHSSSSDGKGVACTCLKCECIRREKKE